MNKDKDKKPKKPKLTKEQKRLLKKRKYNHIAYMSIAIQIAGIRNRRK